jgi:hypothetical protein
MQPEDVYSNNSFLIFHLNLNDYRFPVRLSLATNINSMLVAPGWVMAKTTFHFGPK